MHPHSALADDLDEAPPSTIVPPRPDAPGVPFPRVAEDAYDAELEAISVPRTASMARVVLAARLLSIVVAVGLAFALRYELRFALAPSAPVELSSSATPAELDGAAHRLVSLRGVPGGVGAVDYRRPMSDGLYRLAPLVDRPDVYIEIRLPDGGDPARFIPPTNVQGRLVPLDQAGARFSDARQLLTTTLGHQLPAKVWILETGTTPGLRGPGAMVGSVALVIAILQTLMVVGNRRRAGQPTR